MADMVTKKRRSQIMSKIGSRNTSPEILVRSIIHRMGFRFRLHDTKLPGRPDIVLSRFRKIILVNGCFWHFHRNCKKSGIPKSNSDFWREKFRCNTERDRRNRAILKRQGWGVLVIWQCALEKSLRKLPKRFKIFCRRTTGDAYARSEASGQ